MAIKVGNSYVSEAAYEQAKANIDNERDDDKNSTSSYMSSLQKKMQSWNISTNTQAFGGSGVNNIGVHPSILREMASNPEKRLEYEALMIDIKDSQKSFLSAREQNGTKVIAHGYIIDAKGGLSSWGIIQSADTGKTRTKNTLPRNNRVSWQDIMLGNASKNKNTLYKKDSKVDYRI